MTAQPKKMLCWNCEGRVNLTEENCPYCGVYVNPLSENEENDNKETNLFAPPYRVNDDEQEEQEIPTSPYTLENKKEEKEEPNETVRIPNKFANNPLQTSEMQSIILPMILLLSGTVFFLFGIALLFFSEKGYLTLKWNSSYWYLFFVIALPMLLFGWRFLQKDVSKEEV